MFLSIFGWNKFAFRQCMVGLVVTIDVFLLGAGYTFSATLLPQIEREDSVIEITRSEGTWFASMSSLTCIPGTILGFFCLQLLGRKWCYTMISLSNIIAWSILAFSTQVSHLLVGRALQGLNAGLGYSVCFCFISEVVDLKYRSVLLNMINIGSALGMLLVDTMGSFYPWQYSAYALITLAVVYFCILLGYLKNTYMWYLERGELDRARELYFWYKQETPSSEEHFTAECKLAEIKVTFSELLKEWRRREFLAPLGILMWFNTTIMCTGGFGIMLYSVEIMEGVVSIDEYTTTIVIDVLRVVSTFGTIILMAYTSVRLSINLGSVCCASSLLLISLSLYLKDTWSGWSTVSLIAILAFNFFFNLGYANIANIAMGELLTGLGKSSGTAIAGMYFFVLYFAFGHLVPTMFDNLGHIYSFLVFGICTLVGGSGLFFIMPETKGVSNDQIRMNFQSKETKTKRKNASPRNSIRSISESCPQV